ncbi:MAG: DUF429 domain-containing protein [Burkholderiaceae bacterium]
MAVSATTPGAAPLPTEPSGWRCLGIDFTSAPGPRKPIVIAHGAIRDDGLHLLGLERLVTLGQFREALRRPGPWIGAFDLPFGLPRAFVQGQGWPLQWAACMTHYCAQPRDQLRERFKAWCDARPVGSKFAHRATDGSAGSSPSMKWVNPPVAWMMHAGVPCLREAGLHLPGLAEGDRTRVALEAYPGMLARRIDRRSYKSDARAGDTAARRAVRRALVDALLQGRVPVGLALRASDPLLEQLVAEPGADGLDAVFCLAQAAWAACRHRHGYGMPTGVDPLEGWILGA